MGLSFSAAARIPGVRRATLSDLLNGNASLSSEMAMRVEKAFDLCMDLLLRMQPSGSTASAVHRVRMTARSSDIKKKIKAMVAVIEGGGYARGNMDRMRELEVRQDEFNERLAAVLAAVPGIRPKIADIYPHKVERLADALADPRDRDGAAGAIRRLIERLVLNPGEKRGTMHAALHGHLGTIIE